MSDTEFPITKLYELGRMSQAGDEVTLAPTADERARIARWADVQAVNSFAAKIDMQKISHTRFKLDVTLDADIVQACVVTLEPVHAHITRKFIRELLLTQAPQHAVKEIELTPVDDDGREEIESLRYDLAVPVLEEFALAIDPYPRAPGVSFEAPADAADSADHPFAALKSLKNRS
ncbi:MAG TPA: YceD family protein [Rhizobiaceae bacterium]|nr:YceD family protein [Rhizobiaceae bacterium]